MGPQNPRNPRTPAHTPWCLVSTPNHRNGFGPPFVCAMHEMRSGGETRKKHTNSSVVGGRVFRGFRGNLGPPMLGPVGCPPQSGAR